MVFYSSVIVIIGYKLELFLKLGKPFWDFCPFIGIKNDLQPSTFREV